MSNLNLFVVSGRIGADGELKFTPNGKAVIDFNIAVNDYAGKEKGEVTNWFNCVMFGREKIVSFLKKGTLVTISGKLKQERWEGKNGEKRSAVKLIVNDVQLPGKEKNNNNYHNNNDDSGIPF